MQNLHRHTSFSNIMTSDSTVFNEDYAKRAVELGHKVLSSVEHGWQGYYFETYELAHKYNLKCVIGAEAYWVKDRKEQDKTNCHILILAKNNNGRECLNEILSDANETGYYYKPRVDTELLLGLPPDDVVVTSACIAFNGYGFDDSDDIIKQLHDHFKDNFMLEVQYHNTETQKKWNKHLLELSEKWGIELIVGLDSHYIHEEDAEERDNYLESKGLHYEDEQGWYMDYPDDETVMKRFLEQGVLSKEQIQRAMDNTDIALTFDDYDDVYIFSKEIKLPTLYPDLTMKEREKLYSKLISKQFKEYMKNVPPERYDEYYQGVKEEIQVYKDTGMVDYPLLDYAIVKEGLANGGLITDSGRGSAVGFFTNTLCGFSKVDRFRSAIKLYPERFISTTRILETHSLPDIDLNVGTPEIFEEAQKHVMGEEHVAPMIAFGTIKKSSAFKLYAKAKGMEFKIANEITSQMAAYDEAIKQADDEDKDSINLYDYVDEQYKDYIEESKNYWGVISDKKKAPSAYLLYQGNIRREIGLIKCKSESTKKEYITCVIDGAIAENYKFLKNDWLVVSVVSLIDAVFKRIGIEHFDVNTLIQSVERDEKVWDIYRNGYTIGINQVEQDGSRHKVMRYKPKNISELSAFVAAIRPGFKSMYQQFENREDFSWGIPALDNMLRTEQLPVSFLFFQEQVMSVLNYAGFPMDQCYGIIKAIAKKHPEKVKPLKAQFIDGFRDRLIQDEGLREELAQSNAEQVWTIVNDNCGYGFNCVSGSTKLMIGEHEYSPTVEEMYNQNNYIQAYSMFEDNKIRLNQIVTIAPAGIRQTYLIKTESGCELICTDNHKFPTPNGKKRLDELSVGDKLYCKDERYLITYLSPITLIKPYKVEMTYDIEMADPAHNFVSESGLVASNSAHAYCMALDSLYQAWQKAHYPYEFYEVLLQYYTDKGNKQKVAKLKQEMKKGFGISEGSFRFRHDNRKFTADKDNHVIYSALSSIKSLSDKTAEDLYSLKDNSYDDFVDFYVDLKETSVNSRQLEILIKLNYFEEFGEINQLLKTVELFDKIYGKKVLKVNKLEEMGIPIWIAQKHCQKQTEKQMKDFDSVALLREVLEHTEVPKTNLKDRLKYENELLGYLQTTIPKMKDDYYYVSGVSTYNKKMITLYHLKDGDELTIKVRAKGLDVPVVGDIIKVLEITTDKKWGKDKDGNWYRKDEMEQLLTKYSFVK